MFSIESKDGEARLGMLTTPQGGVATPAFLLYTHRGGFPNLTPDLISTLMPGPQLLQLDALQLCVAQLCRPCRARMPSPPPDHHPLRTPAA